MENAGQDRDRSSLFRLERYLSGEMDPEEAAAVAKSIETDPVLKEFLEKKALPCHSIGFETLKQRFPGPKPEETILPWQSILERVLSLFSPAMPGPAWAILIIAAVAGTAFWTTRSSPSANSMENDILAKGETRVSARVGGNELDAEGINSVRAGDTLHFEYQSGTPLHVQIWFQDDGQKPRPYLGSGDARGLWPPSLSWISGPIRVILDKNWRRETLWIIWSEIPLPDDAIKSVHQKEKLPQGFGEQSFHLERVE